MTELLKANSVVQGRIALDNELVQYRLAYRTAIEAKRIHGCKLAVIVAHMREHGCQGIDEAYLYKQYAGARPITEEYVCALPNVINALFYKLLAEQHEGQIVITPTTGPEGVRQFASGLYGFVQQLGSLPVRAHSWAKADLRATKAKTRTAAGGHR